MLLNLEHKYGITEEELCSSFSLDREMLTKWIFEDAENVRFDPNSREQRAAVGLYRVFHFLREQLPHGSIPLEWMQTCHADTPFDSDSPLETIKKNGFDGLNQVYRYLCATYWPKAYREL